MSTVAATVLKTTEFSGDYKLFVIDVILQSASDTITLVAATHKISEIMGCFIVGTAGMDAAFTNMAATYSTLTITITSIEEDGTASTAWTDTAVQLWVIGK